MFKLKTGRDKCPYDLLLVGLGNPGIEYEMTRHNVGFRAMDAFCDKHDTTCDKLKFKAYIGECKIGTKRVFLAKPQTYMNNSGESVAEIAKFYKIPADRILVMFDDISLEPGIIRIRRKGSAGGHNGLTNITELIGTQDYARIRIGIGNEFGRGQQVNYVLGGLTPEEKEQMPDICKRVIDGIKAWATVGADRAMNVINTKPKPKENAENQHKAL